MNHPEMMLDGQTASEGRGARGYAYMFMGGPMLVSIELRLDLRALSVDVFSDIISQVCAETDGNFSPAPLISSCLVLQC